MTLSHSLFLPLDNYCEPRRSPEERLREAIEEGELAEALGFHAVYCSEHHLSDYGLVPNPAIFLAYLAARTQRIRLGPAIANLNARSPLALAEDYALLDQLSGGRLVLGTGAGYVPSELSTFGVEPANRDPGFIERLSVMRDLMGGRNARYAQPNCLLKQDRLSAPTQQTFGPPVAVASLSNDAAFEIGSAGLALWLMPHAGCATRDELEKIVDAHRDGFRQRLQARPSAVAEFVWPSVAVCLPTHVDTRQHVALNQAKPYLAGHLARRFYPRQTPVETLIEEGFVLIGTPAHVRQSLAWYQEIGITEVMTMHAFGGMPGSVVQASMRKYAERVSSLVSGQSAESSGESA